MDIGLSFKFQDTQRATFYGDLYTYTHTEEYVCNTSFPLSAITHKQGQSIHTLTRFYASQL